MTKTRRIGVFAFGDKDGIVDDYILYLLEDMMKYIEELIITLYTKVDSKQREKLEKFSKRIYEIESATCDVEAWGAFFLEHCKKSDFSSYDEMVIFNDSFFGPFESFGVMFETMKQRNVDFWGISSCSESVMTNAQGRELCVPEHICKYFMVYSAKIIQNNVFFENWEKIFELHSSEAKNIGFNQIFTKTLQEEGFSWQTYISCENIEMKREYSICMDMYYPEYMIIDLKSPILLKGLFGMEYDTNIHFTGGESLVKCMKYIENETNYDASMIWDNILRVNNITDIKQNMHLNFVLPSKYCNPLLENTGRVAVIIHSYYEDLTDDIIAYANNVPSYADLYITTDNLKKKKIIEKKIGKLQAANCQVILTQNRGRDLAALLVTCRDVVNRYDYVCFTHDKKTTGNSGAITVGKSFFYTAIENMLSSTEYISNIIEVFEQNPRLGVLASPAPLHNIYFGAIGREWTVCYEETVKILDEFGVKVKMSPQKQPFVLGTSIWFRTDALEKLFAKEWKHEDFPEEPLGGDGTISHGLERSFPYFAQEKGFYSGWVMTEEYAQLEISNLNFLMTKAISVHQKKKEPYVDFFLKDYLKTYERNTTERASFYIDTGLGYSEEHTIKVIYNIEEDGWFEIIANVPEKYQNKICGVRFDPIEGKGCILSNINIFVDSGSITLIKNNGIELRKETYIHLTEDPWWTYKVDKENVNIIRASGYISVLDGVTEKEVAYILRGINKVLGIKLKHFVKRLMWKILNK